MIAVAQPYPLWLGRIEIDRDFDVSYRSFVAGHHWETYRVVGWDEGWPASPLIVGDGNSRASLTRVSDQIEGGPSDYRKGFFYGDSRLQVITKMARHLFKNDLPASWQSDIADLARS